MARTYRAHSIAALALLVVGCAPAGLTNVGQPQFTSNGSPSADSMPLQYTLQITNTLGDPLTITLTPGERVKLAGPSSFTLARGSTRIAKLSITTFTSGPLVAIEGANADRSQTLHDVVSIVDSAVAVRMRGLTGMDEDAILRRNLENTEVIVTIRAKPAATAAHGAATGYSVTVANDLPSEPLDVSVKAGEHSVLHGPRSFSLEPDARQTVRMTDRGAFAVSDLLEIIDARSKKLTAELELIKSKGDHIDITAMFQIQLMMNKVSQLTEISTSVISASNSAIASMARNVKG